MASVASDVGLMVIGWGTCWIAQTEWMSSLMLGLDAVAAKTS